MGCKTLALIDVLLATAVAAVPAAAVAAATPAASPPEFALLTIADGEVAVLRGRTRFIAAEGQRLWAQDIVHTTNATRVARLEFADGSVLDLGPATRVLLAPQGEAWPRERLATAYLARGWAKLRAAPGTGDGARPAALASASLDIAATPAAVVLARVEPDAAFAFVEAGRAQLVEYRSGRAPREFALGEGHAYQREAGMEFGSASLRPGATLLRATPRALADVLPLRAARFAGRPEPEGGAPQPVASDEVSEWLEAEPALRASLRTRFLGGPPAWARAAGGSVKPVVARSGVARPRPPAGAPRVARLDRRRLAGATATAGAATTALDITEPVLPQVPVASQVPPPAEALPAASAPLPKPAAARSGKRQRPES